MSEYINEEYTEEQEEQAINEMLKEENFEDISNAELDKWDDLTGIPAEWLY